jgi:rhomboid protease GluP
LEALEVNSGHARTHSNIGAAFFDKGMTSDAEMAFAKAIELDPTLSEAHYNLALLYLGQKEYDRAWSHAKNAVDLGMSQAKGLLEEIERTLDTGDAVSCQAS